MKNNLSKMMGLDLYLLAHEHKEKKKLDVIIKPSKNKIMPLLSWDLYSSFFTNINIQLKKESDIKEVEKLALKFDWKTDLSHILAQEDFDALVITNHQKQIIWVNDGFSAMTGYPKNFAINKSPSFLQGKDTLEETKQRIRKKIALHTPFTDVIINYRKDKTPYKCQIKIIPLFAADTTYYIAIEKEVA
jgi:PAS domain S-box-containing protein